MTNRLKTYYQTIIHLKRVRIQHLLHKRRQKSHKSYKLWKRLQRAILLKIVECRLEAKQQKNRDVQQDKLPRDFPQQENETERAKDKNDLLDGEGDAESDNEEENQEKEEFEEGHKIQKLKGKFLRKDNVVYFVDTNGKLLGSQLRFTKTV